MNSSHAKKGDQPSSISHLISLGSLQPLKPSLASPMLSDVYYTQYVPLSSYNNILLVYTYSTFKRLENNVYRLSRIKVVLVICHSFFAILLVMLAFINAICVQFCVQFCNITLPCRRTFFFGFWSCRSAFFTPSTL